MNSPEPKCLLAVPQDSPLFHELWNENSKATLSQCGFNLDFINALPESVDEWRRLISGYDALISSWSTPQINEAILNGNNTLKIIGHAAGSVADLVSEELYNRGIKVTTANDVMARDVATWCLSMTLLGVRNVPEYACIGGNQPMQWEKVNRLKFIQDTVIGVWGYGSISKHYINYLRPLQPKEILVCSEHCSKAELETQDLRKASLEDILSQCDVIVLLAGLTDRNINRVDEHLLAKIKDGAVLLNCGRAKLIEEKALMTELRKNRFLACLDVFYREPLPDNDELQQLNNVILTPHNGGRASRSRYVSVILEEFYRYFNGQPLSFEVSRARAMSMTSHKKVFAS